LLIISAPVIHGICSLVNSTRDSLTFTWNSAESATSYRLVGDVGDRVTDISSDVNTTTVSNLTPGSHYSFTVWAVSAQQLTSNNITCVESTGNVSYSYVACSLS